jgi:predicted  nucleic acid-binding Zn-ribbon protein
MNKKDAYIEKAQAKIEEYACKLDELKAKTKGEIAGLKIDAQEQLDKLEAKLDAAKLRLAELADSAEDKWEDLSGRFEVLADDLGSSFKKFFEKH